MGDILPLLLTFSKLKTIDLQQIHVKAFVIEKKKN